MKRRGKGKLGLEAQRVGEKQEHCKESLRADKSHESHVEAVPAGPGRLRRVETGQPRQGGTLPPIHRWLLAEIGGDR